MLSTVELPVPKPLPGQLLIKLEAVGMNFQRPDVKSGSEFLGFEPRAAGESKQGEEIDHADGGAASARR